MSFSSVRQSIYGLVVQIRRGSVCYIGGSDLLPPPLTREEEVSLVRKVHQSETCAWWSTSPASLKTPASALRI